jgi:hypothetical protein
MCDVNMLVCLFVCMYLDLCARTCIYIYEYISTGARGSIVIKALCYKAEGRVFETR